MLRGSATGSAIALAVPRLGDRLSAKIPPGPPNLYGATGKFSHNVISYSTALSGDFEAVPNLCIADFWCLLLLKMSAWRAHPLCPLDASKRVERAVRALPAGYHEAPQADEVFESAEACLLRLQGYALSQGFAVVKASGSLSSKRPRIQYKCVHYGRETRNFRQLEDHVQRNAKKVITTQRKRENTLILKKDCQ
jgi:hypothetical protein